MSDKLAEFTEKFGKLDLLENTKPLSWMNQEFFDTVIRHHTKDTNAEVHSFEILPGSKPGENFASILYRCKLNYSSKHESKNDISVIVKTIPEVFNLKKDFLEKSPLFQTEMQMYDGTLQEIQALWRSVGDDSTLCPKLIYQTEKPNMVIVLEDISPLGFGMIDKPPQNYEDSKMIARRLAKFHAASFYLASEKQRDYSNYDICMFKTMDPQVTEVMFNQSVKIFIEELKSWEGFEEYIPKLENFAETLTEMCTKMYQPNSHYNVLNHGDHHTKNLMFKKIDGEIKDVCFVDYQLCVYASPAIDLIYSLYCDISSENRQKYRDEYIKYYHDEFVKALKSYGYLKALPSLLDLHIELLKCGGLETIMSVCFMVFMFIDWSTTDPEEFSFENLNNFKKKLYANPECQTVMKAELPRLFYKGIL